MAEPLTDAEQQQLIAVRLNMEEDTQFLRFLAAIWPEYEFYIQLPAGYQLRRLYVTREGINWLLGRNWDKRDIKMGDIQRKDSSLANNLLKMLDRVQDDINTIVGRTQSRPAASGALGSRLVDFGAPGDPARGTT